MARAVSWLKGITSVINGFTTVAGLSWVPVVNRETGRWHIMDGVTPGGLPHALLSDIPGAAPTVYSSPTTGATVTAGAGEQKRQLIPAGTLATLTVTLPSIPNDDNEHAISTTQQITALTVNAPGGASVVGGTVGTLPLAVRYVSAIVRRLQRGIGFDMPRSILIGKRDWVREPGVTFSGGLWQEPLTNLANINPQITAKAGNSDPTSSIFIIDLGVSRPVELLFFMNFRVSVNGIIRLRGGTDPTFVLTSYDTGLIAAWPEQTYSLSYDLSVFTAIGSYREAEYARLGLPRYFPFDAPITMRYIKVEIWDITNPSIEVGVFGACSFWESPVNLRYDRSVGLVDAPVINRSAGGGTIVRKRHLRQRHTFVFGALPDIEIWLRAFSLALTASRSIPLVIIYDPDDTKNLEKNSIYGLTLQPVEFAQYFHGYWSLTVHVDQLV